MNDKLPPEVRVKVAASCSDFEPSNIVIVTVHKTGFIEADEKGNQITHSSRVGWNVNKTPADMMWFWEPEERLEQKDALTRTAARLIAEKPDCMPRLMLFERLGKAIATNDVNALERLVAELKGFL